MDERRRNKRIELVSKIIIKRLDGNEVDELAIDVTDVSKTGVGFACSAVLQIGAVYETYLTIWTKEVLHAFIEIVRIEKKDNLLHYGSIFIGMPETESSRISVYQTIEELKNK